MNVNSFMEFRNKIVENCSKVIVGKEDVIEKIAVAFLCSGHVLLEDLPGTGKTMLLRAFSKTMTFEQFSTILFRNSIKLFTFILSNLLYKIKFV